MAKRKFQYEFTRDRDDILKELITAEVFGRDDGYTPGRVSPGLSPETVVETALAALKLSKLSDKDLGQRYVQMLNGGYSGGHDVILLGQDCDGNFRFTYE